MDSGDFFQFPSSFSLLKENLVSVIFKCPALVLLYIAGRCMSWHDHFGRLLGSVTKWDTLLALWPELNKM